MDSYEFAQQLIASQTILDFETFTEKAIKAILANDLKQQNFLDVLNDFKSFEGLNHKFIVNFTGAWLKCALNGQYDKYKLNAGKIIRAVLGTDFQEKERVGHGSNPLLSNDLYAKINWNATNLPIDTTDDYSSQRKYMIMKCQKKQHSNNSMHDVQMILLRPKDFLEVITRSTCVTEYRRYFITLAEIRRSYQETYLPWLISYKDSLIQRKDDKIDELKADIKTLLADNQKILARTDYIIGQNEQLHIKFDAMFEYLLSFAKMTIPTWVGSLVMYQQYQNFAESKGSGYAMGHMKVLFMVGFYTPLDEYTTETKRVSGRIITFTGKARMIIYCCCTNINNVDKRISELYARHTNGKDEPMFMLRPLAITLISCEINLERITLENSDMFPEQSLSKWKPKYKRFDLTINKSSYPKVNTIFETICEKATTQRFQGYQKRIQQFNQSNDVKVDTRIIKYIDNVDTDFYSSAKPFCQMYLDSYTMPTYKDDQLYEYESCKPSLDGTTRPDFKDRSLSQHKYSLSILNRMLKKSADIDYVQLMAEQGILCKNDLPSLKAMAKFEKIDVSYLKPPTEYDSE
jgi:hypothetical protein